MDTCIFDASSFVYKIKARGTNEGNQSGQHNTRLNLKVTSLLPPTCHLSWWNFIQSYEACSGHVRAMAVLEELVVTLAPPWPKWKGRQCCKRWSWSYEHLCSNDSKAQDQTHDASHWSWALGFLHGAWWIFYCFFADLYALFNIHFRPTLHPSLGPPNPWMSCKIKGLATRHTNETKGLVWSPSVGGQPPIPSIFIKDVEDCKPLAAKPLWPN